MNTPPIALVILNWNGLQHLKQFLPSILSTTYPNYKVYVIDNASSDESVTFLREKYPNINIIINNSNYGYAEGYNQGLLKIEEPYWVLLNSDLEVTPNWLEPLVQTALRNPNWAAIQPKILSYDEKNTFEYAGASGGYLDLWGYPFCRGRIFDKTEKDIGQYNEETVCFWASGACMFVRKEAFWKVGGFDPDFFAHMEEIDLCWRLQNSDFKIGVAPSSVVYHLGGGSLAYGNPRKTYLNFRNSLMVLTKNLPIIAMMYTVPIRLILDFPAALKFFFEGNKADAFAVAKAHWYFFFKLLTILKKRANTNPKLNLKMLSGVYKGLLPWAFYKSKKNTFTSLKTKIVH